MPKSMGIFSIEIDETLPTKYREVFEAEIASAIRRDKQFKLFFCYECQSPQLELKGDQILITKGVSDSKRFKDYASKYGVESFALIKVVESGLSVNAAITIVDGSNGQVIDSKVLRAASSKLGNTAFHFMTHIGGGIAIGGDSGADETVAGMADFVFFESLSAFRKFGYSVGGVYGKRRFFAYIAPTYAWRGKVGKGLKHSLYEFGVGPAFGSGSVSGLAIKFNYDYFIGSLFGVGAGAKTFVPLFNTDNEEDSLTGAIGFHLIFNIGG